MADQLTETPLQPADGLRAAVSVAGPEFGFQPGPREDVRVRDVAPQPAAAAGVWRAPVSEASPSTASDTTRRHRLRVARSPRLIGEESTRRVLPS